MNAIVLEKPGAFRVTTAADPSDLPPGHARVRVRRETQCSANSPR